MVEIIKIDFENPDRAINIALQVLKKGGIISFPTETFYGLGVNAFNEKAVSKVFQTKERDLKKPLIVFIASEKQFSGLIPRINATAKKLIDSYWPGPLTLVFEASSKLPTILTGGTGKIGIRISGNSFVRRLCQTAGFPITGSSANVSDRPGPASAENVSESLGDKIDLILDGGRTKGTQSSTVLDISGPVPILIRPGVVSREIIEETLKLSIKKL